MVGREGIEPPTRRASTYRSSIWAINPNQDTFFKIGFEPITFRLQTNALPIELLLAHAKELLSVPLFYFVNKALISSGFLTISVTQDTPRGGLLNVSLAGAGFEPAISNLWRWRDNPLLYSAVYKIDYCELAVYQGDTFL